MSDQDQNSEVEKKALDEWVQTRLGESYTQAFNIRKVMYRIQNMDLPFKRGIRVEQFLAFFLGLILAFVVWSLLLSPLLSLLDIQLPWTFIALYFLGPPFLLSARMGKPMPHQKSIQGTVMTFLRYSLDDVWHRRGMPVNHGPDPELEGNYLRVWTVDPAFVGIESEREKPATEFMDPVPQDLPDHKVSFTEKEKVKILEADDEFEQRINVGFDGLRTAVQKRDQEAKSLSQHNAEKASSTGEQEAVVVDDELEEFVPVLDREAIQRSRSDANDEDDDSLVLR